MIKLSTYNASWFESYAPYYYTILFDSYTNYLSSVVAFYGWFIIAATKSIKYLSLCSFGRCNRTARSIGSPIISSDVINFHR